MQPWKIVIVDDDLQVLDVHSRLLNKMGHEVIPFADPATAIEYFNAHGKEIDLLVSDFLMPTLNGLELISRVRPHFGSLHTLILTGFSEDEALQEASRQGVAVLSKPLRYQKLHDHIAALQKPRGMLSTSLFSSVAFA